MEERFREAYKEAWQKHLSYDYKFYYDEGKILTEAIKMGIETITTEHVNISVDSSVNKHGLLQKVTSGTVTEVKLLR